MNQANKPIYHQVSVSSYTITKLKHKYTNLNIAQQKHLIKDIKNFKLLNNIDTNDEK